MDAQALKQQIINSFDCDNEEIAQRIADEAKKYHQNKETDKTVDDWICYMEESNQSNPVLAWNWAVATKDGDYYGDNNCPYKIDTSKSSSSGSWLDNL